MVVESKQPTGMSAVASLRVAAANYLQSQPAQDRAQEAAAAKKDRKFTELEIFQLDDKKKFSTRTVPLAGLLRKELKEEATDVLDSLAVSLGLVASMATLLAEAWVVDLTAYKLLQDRERLMIDCVKQAFKGTRMCMCMCDV